jgi:hypothetical protein
MLQTTNSKKKKKKTAAIHLFQLKNSHLIIKKEDAINSTHIKTTNSKLKTKYVNN